MRKRAVLFDLDGTLLDTLADIGESVNEALAELGAPPHPLDAYRRFVGDGMQNLACRSLPAGRADAETVDRCVAAMRRIYGSRAMRNTRPYVGIPELLTELERRHVAMAVLSNKPDDLTKELIDAFFGAQRFAAVCGARTGVARKPDPEAACDIARRLGVAPADFLYLGDTDTDMRTAVASGMEPVGALWGFRDAAELEASGARALVREPAGVLALLE